MTTKTFEVSLAQISSTRPATDRVLLEYGVDGQLHITSTMDPDDTIHALDKAMEAIDGQRLPPDGK